MDKANLMCLVQRSLLFLFVQGIEENRPESSSSLEKLDSNVDSLSTTDEEVLPSTVPKVCWFIT